jgi:hypothetical protein
MYEEHIIVRALVTRAAERFASFARLAGYLGVDISELQRCVAGESMPSQEVLLKLVDLTIEDLRAMKQEFSAAAWSSLFRPRSES